MACGTGNPLGWSVPGCAPPCTCNQQEGSTIAHDDDSDAVTPEAQLKTFVEEVWAQRLESMDHCKLRVHCKLMLYQTLTQLALAELGQGVPVIRADQHDPGSGPTVINHPVLNSATRSSKPAGATRY
jgi:hypothetical protein